MIGFDKYLQTINHSGKLKQLLPLLLMTVPFFFILVAFSYVPLWGWSMAFVDYSPGVSILASKFVFFKYFIRLFSGGSEFLMVMRNTLVLSFLNIAVTPVPIVLAIMITELRNSKLKKLVQTVTSFPNFISWIIVYSLFFAFFSVDDGLINNILTKLNIVTQPIDFLGTPSWTWWLMTFASVWKSAGWTSIIYLAAISGIDQEQYQAAQVDGAGRLAQIWHITVPGILPTYAVILILTVANLLNMGFDQYYVFHNALVHERIEVLDTYAYRVAFEASNDFSLSTAVGIFKTVVSVILLFVANGLYKKIRGSSIIS